MVLQLTCPNCARTLLVPENSGGDFAVCNSCGGRVLIPAKGFGAGASIDGMMPPVEEPYGNPYVSPPLSPDPAAPVKRPDVRKWIAIGGGAVLLLAGIVWWAWPKHETPSWEAEHRDAVLAMIDDFERSAEAGDFPEAVSKYRKMDALVVGQSITDPTLRAALDRAAAEKRKVSAAQERQATTRQAMASILSQDGTKNDPIPAPLPDPRNPPATTQATPATLPIQSLLHVARQEPTPDPVSDALIGAAIQKGADWLIPRFDARTHYLALDRPQSGDAAAHGGLDALCVYALLQCSLAIQDERLDIHKDFMKSILRALDTLPMEKRFETYGRGLRAAALSVYNRKDDHKFLKADVDWLLKSHRDGGYTYGGAPDADAIWDNSNSQYGLLGVWAGAEAGINIPDSYWQTVQKHWLDCQFTDGGWGYRPGSSSVSMTLAGVASLFVCQDNMEPVEATGQVGRPPFSPALARGLQWLEEGARILDTDGTYGGYALYGVERVGLASGFKSFGIHDWYRARAREVLRRQAADGSWGDDIETSYALLFLARGRHPIMMNKVRFDGHWANRPRDVTNLARFASRELERPISFQVVNIERDAIEWEDSPILYLASDAAPDLTEDQIDNLRRYVEAGGLLFTQADGGSAAFDQYAKQLARRLFPQYPLAPMPADHDIYSILYKINPAPPLLMASNGARVLMVHSPQDLSIAWQQRKEKTRTEAFQVGVSLFLYTAGKTELRNRTASSYIPDPPAPKGGTLRVARVRYDGPWDPEPGAWAHFSRWFQQETGCGVELMPVELESRLLPTAPFAHMTGTSAFAWTPGQEEAVRDYVDGGGTLLIDSTGNGAFAKSARQLLAHAFSKSELKKLSPSHPLQQGGVPGMDALPAVPALRRFAAAQLGKGAGMVECLAHGKGHVILAPLDVTSGLLDTQTWGIVGYTPAYSRLLLKNALIWAAASGPDSQPASETP